MKECYHYAINERGGVQFEVPNTQFPTNPKIEMILLAVDFPVKNLGEFDIWNTLSLVQLQTETQKYAINNEFRRFQNLTSKDLDQLHERVVKRMKIEL